MAIGEKLALIEVNFESPLREYILRYDLGWVVSANTSLSHRLREFKMCIVNKPYTAHPPKFAQYQFYIKGQQGAVFLFHMNEVRCEVFQVIYKRDCSLQSLSVEMVLGKLRRLH